MKFAQQFSMERFAKPAARFMQYVCYFLIFLHVFCLALSFMGRQTFFLHTKTGTFERAIYAEENHALHSRGMTVNSGDDIHVWTNDEDQINLAVQIGLSLMYAVDVAPMILAFWFLSCVFANIRKGQIFTEQNAAYLLYYGLLRLFAAGFAPFIKLLICRMVNLATDCRMSISTGQAMLNMLIPSIGFIVAAYIIHYGVSLQDEVDHTL